MGFWLIFVIVFSIVLTIMTVLIFTFGLPKTPDFLQTLSDKKETENEDTKTKEANETKDQVCLLVNPKQVSGCYIGAITKESKLDSALHNDKYNTLPMRLLFGSSTADEKYVWNQIHPMTVHDGCDVESIDTPFIVNCDDIEKGHRLIKEFYNRHHIDFISQNKYA